MQTAPDHALPACTPQPDAPDHRNAMLPPAPPRFLERAAAARTAFGVHDVPSATEPDDPWRALSAEVDRPSPSLPPVEREGLAVALERFLDASEDEGEGEGERISGVHAVRRDRHALVPAVG